MARKAKNSEHLHFEQIASQIGFSCNQRQRCNILYRHTKKKVEFYLQNIACLYMLSTALSATS